MTNGSDKCANCGGDRAIHHYQTDQCPVGGVEASGMQEWKTSTFLNQTHIPANDTAYPFICDGYVSGGLTKREYFAATMMQGLLASWGQHDVEDYRALASDAVLATNALIAALNEVK